MHSATWMKRSTAGPPAAAGVPARAEDGPHAHAALPLLRGGAPKPRNPLQSDVVEGGRGYQAVLVPKQCLMGTHSGATTVSDSFWPPDGV